ncbi:ABC transporter ATP-binding protein [Bifidobacterium sp. ESL0732]|uniref:ABC transporter ATP-binding protein n=1 Tax=Bifidobacterium sp. ESL0732 TaxID=2983222 RepID=UPI0023F859DC|nr:ABC transporter ATP-binding protein [Bifidobacterium sp. ESL0732]WEV64264.1 ABC transporter ATP-binding protein [Bifidobacterium sp. ESL0732]
MTQELKQESKTNGALTLRNVSKIYPGKKGDFTAVQGTSLDIKPGTFVTLLGPSGCGKTTTLRMIAGFEQPTGGDILVDGKSVLEVPADKRPMSMVFQSYALFPHLTVLGNVEFGLKLQKLSKQEYTKKANDALKMMGIEEYANRYPNQLSGGQQQRVALARALVMEPEIILFDEPLSNLDAKLRVKMRGEIRQLQQRLGITAIFVTHDQSEALTMADVIVVMSNGKVEQVGTPWEIYHRPSNRFVASFLGTDNFMGAKVVQLDKHASDADVYTLETSLGNLHVRGVSGLKPGDKAAILLRAENLLVGNRVEDADSGSANKDESEATAGDHIVNIDAQITSSAFDGEAVQYELDSDVGHLTGSAPGATTPFSNGVPVTCRVDADTLWVVPESNVAEE